MTEIIDHIVQLVIVSLIVYNTRLMHKVQKSTNGMNEELRAVSRAAGVAEGKAEKADTDAKV